MSIEDIRTVERLERLVSRFTSNATLQEDLMQEALVHLWLIQQQLPGQTESWYLQSCRFHLQHFLAAGRSVDSHKRSGGRVYPPENGEDRDILLDIVDNEETCEAVLADISARDIIAAMSKWLPEIERTVLRYLAEGLGTCDIAKRLSISHPMVIKHRRKIAALATKLAIASLSEFRKEGLPMARQNNFETCTHENHNVSQTRSTKYTDRVNLVANTDRLNRLNSHKQILSFVVSESF